MARGDGAHYHFIMNVAIQLALPEPAIQERQNNARGDGLVTRSMVAFVQTHNDNNDRREELNQAERQEAVIEQADVDDNPFPLVEQELPQHPLEQLDDFLLYDFESDDSDTEGSSDDYEMGNYSDGLEFSSLEDNAKDTNDEDSHSEMELSYHSAAWDAGLILFTDFPNMMIPVRGARKNTSANISFSYVILKTCLRP